MYFIFFFAAGLIDIGDRLTALSFGTMSNRTETLLKLNSTTEIKELQIFFDKNPLFVDVEFYRIDASDGHNLPVMPVPSMIGPFEKIRRKISVDIKGNQQLATPSPEQRTEGDAALEIIVVDGQPDKASNVQIEAGLHFLKVRHPQRSSS
jgi:hypothetical protein